MTNLTTSWSRFIGCDVGKTAITVFDTANGGTTTLRNDPDELAAFATSLDDASLVICEPTGGHETALLDALIRAGRAAHRADARKVKAFIRSLGTLAKTDAIDARALARYGQERHRTLALWQPRDAQRDRMRVLVMTRRDLVNQSVAFKNRLSAPGAGPVEACLRRLIEALKTEIAALEAELASLVRDHEPLAQSFEALKSIRGIGHTTAIALLALMPELGALNRRQAAALAGLAPHPRQSGATDAYRRTTGGRPEIKRLLFMAALSAARHDPNLKAFYQRLRANSKKPLVALTALMRKIIVIANARLRSAHYAI